MTTRSTGSEGAAGPVEAFRPEYAALAAELAFNDSSILVAKVNIDENKDLAERYGVESLPTLKWFEGGEALVTYNEEPTKENVNKWINKIIKGYSKELKSADDVKRKEVAVVAVFKQETTEENDEIRSAFRRLALSGKETAFFHTEDSALASELGLAVAPNTASSRIALFRNYKKHPAAIVQYEGHPAASKNGSRLQKFRAFYHAEKLPDYLSYGEELNSAGRLIMSVPINHHMYVLAPEEKLASEKLQAVIRSAANKLRGQVIVITSDPLLTNPDTGDLILPKAFSFDPGTTKYFISVANTGENKRYNCVISSEDELTSEALVKCWEAILAGDGTRIFASRPVPEKPLDNNNITIVVGSTFKSIAEDPTKDVLLQLYYPWSEDCKAFAPTYARLAAALAGVPSLVVAKMDITEDEHPDTFQEYPTLLLYPAEKDAKALIVPATNLQAVAEFIQKHAKIPFELPDLAPFKALKVKMEGFEGADEAAAPEGKFEGTEEDSEEDPYLDDEDDEEVGAGRDEL